MQSFEFRTAMLHGSFLGSALRTALGTSFFAALLASVSLTATRSSLAAENVASADSPAASVVGMAPVETSKLTLSIRDAVKLALERNPDIRAAREKLTESDESLALAISQLFPTLSATGSASRQKNTVILGALDAFGGNAYNQYALALKLNQPLYQNGSIAHGIAFSKKEQEIRKKDVEVLERDLTVQVIQSFYNVLSTQQLLELLKNQQQIQKRAMDTADRYYRIGRGPLVDVLQLKTQHALLTPKIASMESNVKAAASQLATLLHETQSAQLELNLKGQVVTIDPKSIPAESAPIAKLPEVTRSSTALSQVDDRIAVTMASHYPSLNLLGSLGRTAYVATDLLDDYSTNWSVGLQLNIPLFSGLSSIHQRRVLESQKAQQEFAHQRLLDNTSFSRSNAVRNLKVAQANVESSTQAQGFASALLKESERTYRLQISDLLRFLNAQQSYLDAEFNLVDAKYKYVDAVARYYASLGLPMEELVSRFMEGNGARRSN